MSKSLEPTLAHLKAQVEAELQLLGQLIGQFEADQKAHGNELDDHLVLAGFAHTLQSYYNGEILVIHVSYEGDYRLKIEFNDGTSQLIDFREFLENSLNPHINKYQNLKLFRAFHVAEGDLFWNDHYLCFPVADLYANQISKSDKHSLV